MHWRSDRERIRDKFAASRAKGLWMGGIPPLGYDVRDRKLIVNPAEAQLVRRFLDLGSVLIAELADQEPPASAASEPLREAAEW